MLVSLIIGLDELERLTVGFTWATCTHKRIVVGVELGLEDLILSNGFIALAVDRLIADSGLLQFVLQVDGLLLNVVLFQQQFELCLFRGAEKIFLITQLLFELLNLLMGQSELFIALDKLLLLVL